MMAWVYGFQKVRTFSFSELSDRSEGIIPKTRFSVIIPFRNEAENLPDLLKSIEKLKYPEASFEIIFVNDASEDNSEAILYEAIQKSKFSIKTIQNKRVSNSPKKDAISEAVQQANFEWIATTDADCTLSSNWLKSFDRFIQLNNPMMVCGPVKYESADSFIENFQELDGLSLQAVGVGGFGFNNPLLSNGANLAYTKNAFLEVNGFSGNDHIASGDDIFLMEKMKRTFPGRVQFLKSEEAIVSTKPQKNWKDVINQRIRWASKTSKQKSITSLFLGALVFLVNISILVLPILMIFDSERALVYLLLIVFKIITDFVFIQRSAQFFNVKISFWKFPLQTFVYAAVIFIVVLGSFRGKYLWKGRSIKKMT
ncbi:glycosyltransferase family 2 protein [Aequorivita capsosiphonis]|uniref:glycosyltransferase family 2 protein n=1 Tax=Aequorivita capsosiphonis TaxID=487317 RepID=UPI00146F946F|nr:glycosyltransferase [Aequorivita capsosiphonis]